MACAAAALAGGLACLTCLPFTALTAECLAGAFLAGADLEAAAFAAGFLMGFAGFLEWDALVTEFFYLLLPAPVAGPLEALFAALQQTPRIVPMP